jgi:hypothetical protein
MGEPILPDFDYTSHERIQRSIERTTYERIEPVSTIQRGIEIQFVIKPSALFTALHETELFVRYRVFAADGVTAVGANGTASVKNNIFHTMWSSIQIKLNGNDAETVSDYPYRAYIQTLTEFDEDVLKKRGNLIGWAKDTNAHMDVMVGQGNAATNLGAVARSQAGSPTHALMGKLFTDLMQQGRSIPPHTEIIITLHLATDNFALGGAAADNQVLTILDAHLIVARQRVPKALSLTIEKMFLNKPPPLVTRKVRINKHIINANVGQVTLNSLFNAPPGVAGLPDRFIVGFVANTAVVGSRVGNPFNFGTHNLSMLEAKHEDRSLDRYDLAWDTTSGYLKAYKELLKEFNANDANNHALNITLQEFATGYALFPFNLVQRVAGGAVLGPTEIGNVKLEVTFSQAPAAPLTCIVLCEYRGHYDIRQPGSSGPGL